MDAARWRSFYFFSIPRPLDAITIDRTPFSRHTSIKTKNDCHLFFIPLLIGGGGSSLKKLNKPFLRWCICLNKTIFFKYNKFSVRIILCYVYISILFRFEIEFLIYSPKILLKMEERWTNSN